MGHPPTTDPVNTGDGTYCEDPPTYCPEAPFTPTPQAGGTSTPTVTFSGVPASVAVGQTATMTATVSPSSNTLPISLSISNPASIVSPTGAFTTTTPVVVKGLSVGTATITATVSNSDGGKPITVGSTSLPVVASQVPTSLSVLNVTVLPNGQGLNFGCSGLANYGIMVDIKYQVLDQSGNPIASANMTPYEQGTSFSGQSYSGNIGPSGFTNSTLTTAADGTFHDVPFGACANGAFSSATNTQNITIIMPDGSTPAVRSQTFTATGQTAGHGTLKNGSDISATR